MKTAISLIDLFKRGCHKGRSKSKTFPKMSPYVYGYSRGMSIIDLVQTKEGMDKALDFIYRLGETNRQILVVGTSRHISDLVVNYSAKMGTGMPFVSWRWLGGTLTNWDTIRKTLKTLSKLKALRDDTEEFATLKKKEKLSIDRKIQNLELIFGGLTILKNNRPAAILVLDPTKDDLAVKEAGDIPVIGLANTNENPEGINYLIPSNTYSRAFIDFFLEKAVESYNAGQEARAKAATEAANTPRVAAPQVAKAA